MHHGSQNSDKIYFGKFESAYSYKIKIPINKLFVLMMMMVMRWVVQPFNAIKKCADDLLIALFNNQITKFQLFLRFSRFRFLVFFFCVPRQHGNVDL